MQFTCRCTACEIVVTATGTSKKEAKQNVANEMLKKLGEKGILPGSHAARREEIISKSDIVPKMQSQNEILPSNSASYVSLLNEHCQKYALSEVQYDFIETTGPPHMRQFTVRAKVQDTEFVATSTCKKGARQLAAEKLYHYLRKDITSDKISVVECSEFTSEVNDATTKLSKCVMDDNKRPKAKSGSLNVTGLTPLNLTEVEQEKALRTMEETKYLGEEKSLETVVRLLKCKVEYVSLGPIVTVVISSPRSPEIVLAGVSSVDAAREALDFLKVMFRKV